MKEVPIMAYTLRQEYAENTVEITDFCKENNLKMVELDDAFHIFTAAGSWKLTEKALFHKNNTRGYHVQNVQYTSLFDYLAYIADHDLFRNTNPVCKKKNANQCPHAFKAATKYRKQIWRKSELRNILDFMEGSSLYQFA